MTDRVEVKCLSPLEWRLGWLKSVLVFVGIVGVAMAFQARARGYPFSIEVLVVAVVALLAAFFWASKVTLLEDGLAFTRYGFTKFIPYSKIRKTEAVQRLGSAVKRRETGRTEWTVYCALRLHLEDGTTFDIGTGTSEVNISGMQSWVIGQYGDYGAFHRGGFI